jgi:hypothetical protein
MVRPEAHGATDDDGVDTPFDGARRHGYSVRSSPDDE